MSLEVSSRHVRILRTGERGGPRLSFMASELLRWLSALPQSQAQAAYSQPTSAMARRRLASVLGPYQLQLVLKQCCLAKKLAKVQNIVEFINDLVLSSYSDGPPSAVPSRCTVSDFSRFFSVTFSGFFLVCFDIDLGHCDKQNVLDIFDEQNFRIIASICHALEVCPKIKLGHLIQIISVQVLIFLFVKDLDIWYLAMFQISQ